jgi:putative methionine-R-sulfoxide reductase with GAF domain
LKTYRSPRELLAAIERRLEGNSRLPHRSPLEDVTELLSSGRHYSWVGIYLAVGGNAEQQLLGGGGPQPAQAAHPKSRSKVLVSMKLAGRELGVLDVESERENAFGSEDRVLLERVAAAVGHFLIGPGRYLVRHAREAAAGAKPARAKVARQ